MKIQLLKSVVVMLLGACCASQPKRESTVARPQDAATTPSNAGMLAKAKGARAGVFNATTGAWTDTGPPCTDTRPTFRMAMENVASALLMVPALYGAGMPPSVGNGYSSRKGK